MLKLYSITIFNSACVNLKIIKFGNEFTSDKDLYSTI